MYDDHGEYLEEKKKFIANYPSLKGVTCALNSEHSCCEDRGVYWDGWPHSIHRDAILQHLVDRQKIRESWEKVKAAMRKELEAEHGSPQTMSEWDLFEQEMGL